MPSLLGPLDRPLVAVAGALEPAYEVAGDSFDYALNDHILHVAVIDAMGHGLGAALMATLAIGAYRHARRFDVGLEDLYAAMDKAVASQFGTDRFATAQMARLDVRSGLLQWVNAGHPAPLLLRDHRIVAELKSPTTLPVGYGGAAPAVTQRALEKGDRVLFFTDGVVEEDRRGGADGQARLRVLVERVSDLDDSVQETVRLLSSALMRERRGVTTDDATLLLLEWRGGTIDHLVVME
jgi:serine phosphatase RsbU (regulator of sigma subunit)